MSTANKLLYLGETKSILKDTINMSNANITNSTTFRNYAMQLKEGYIDILNNGTDTLYNNFTHLTGKNTTLSFAPTYQAPMKITCYGSTTQETTTGKNLFEVLENEEKNNVKLTYNSDGSYTLNGTASASANFSLSSRTLSAGDYSLQCKFVGTLPNNSQPRAQVYSSNTSFILSVSNNASSDSVANLTLSSNATDVSFRIRIESGFNYQNVKIYPMLVKGTYTSSTMPNFEKYTGGQPSPNPNYSQTINTTTGNQTISVSDGTNTDTYNIGLSRNNVLNSITWRRIKTSGGYPVANDTVTTIISSDNNNITFTAIGDYGGVESDFMPVKNGDKYTISFSGTLPNRFFITQYNSSRTRVSTLNTTTSVSTTTFTASQDGYVAFGFSNTSLSSNNFIIKNIMVNTGETALNYEPYIEPIELCKIGDYEDKIDKSTGKNLFDESYYNDATLYTQKTPYFASLKLPDSFKTKFYGNMNLKGTSQSLVFGFSNSNNSVSTRMLSGGTITNNVEYDFTNATDVYLVIGNSSGINVSTDIPKIFNNYNIMVSKTSGESYEPYGTDWYLKKNIGKVVLDGSENNLYQSNTANGRRNYIAIDNILMPTSGNTTPLMFSNYFTPTNPNKTWTDDISAISINTSNNYLLIKTVSTMELDTVDKFKTWLSTHNTDVYYVLATPTYTKITDSTLIEQLEAIKSKDNTTNITSSMVIGAVALKKE